MGKIKDLTGQKFGKLTVLEITTERRNRQVVWKCQCNCGNIVYIVGSSLRNGHTQSCGCSWYEDKAEDLTGQQFGKLTVLKRNKDKNNKSRNAYWDCWVKEIPELDPGYDPMRITFDYSNPNVLTTLAMLGSAALGE